MQICPLHILAEVAIADGDYAAARRRLDQALGFLSDGDDPVALAQVLETLGELAAGLGKDSVAFRLVAAAEAARQTLDKKISRSIPLLPHFPITRDLRDRWLVPLREAVADEDAKRWWTEGTALSLHEVIGLARMAAVDMSAASTHSGELDRTSSRG
jgi:hypothetical protein